MESFEKPHQPFLKQHHHATITRFTKKLNHWNTVEYHDVDWLSHQIILSLDYG